MLLLTVHSNSTAPKRQLHPANHHSMLLQLLQWLLQLLVVLRWAGGSRAVEHCAPTTTRYYCCCCVGACVLFVLCVCG